MHISNLKYTLFVVNVKTLKSRDMVFKATVPLLSHSLLNLLFFILLQKTHLIAVNVPKSLGYYRRWCYGSGALGGGGDQEAGEYVAGAALAALARHNAVVSGCLQWHCVSGLQLQDRRAGGDQETFRIVTKRHVTVAALHKLQTHLDVNKQIQSGAQIHRSMSYLNTNRDLIN